MSLHTNVRRHSEEDEDRRWLERKAEPLVVRLERGLNFFDPEQFVVLVEYLLPEREWVDTLRGGRFSVDEITVIRLDGRLVTLSEVARESGVSQRNLWNWVSNARLPHTRRGSRKLYNIRDIAILLEKRGA